VPSASDKPLVGAREQNLRRDSGKGNLVDGAKQEFLSGGFQLSLKKKIV